jgi:lipid II isoglutaminyl synthase (glutamine-hydrolysing)
MPPPELRLLALYPEQMNIYADRGNVLFLQRRCEWRGIGFAHAASGPGESFEPAEHDLIYIGGGQDRDQVLVAEDMLRTKRDAIASGVGDGAVLLAVCGGYQLLGRFYRDQDGVQQPGAGIFPHETIAGDRRMIGDVLLECELEPGVKRTLAGFENHAGRTHLDGGAAPLGRVIHGFGNDGRSGFEGCRVGRAVGTYLHGPLLPRNPWFADWVLAQALAHRLGDPPALDPLPDDLERQAHELAAGRARQRGGRF